MKRTWLLGVLGLVSSSGCFNPITQGLPVEEIECGDGLMACGGECVSLRNSDAHCGDCDNDCGAGRACAGARCHATSCADTVCSPEHVCYNDAACLEKTCVDVTCPEDQACYDGKCLPRECGHTTCPVGMVCIDGACFDPACEGVSCPSPKVCLRGVCVSPSCTDEAGGESCATPPAGECIEDDSVYRSYGYRGWCDAESGSCQYDHLDTDCPDCTATCAPRCADVLCTDVQGGCLTGFCVPTDPATCTYEPAQDGARCELSTGEAGNLDGYCLDGGCGQCAAATDCPRAAGRAVLLRRHVRGG